MVLIHQIWDINKIQTLPGSTEFPFDCKMYFHLLYALASYHFVV